MAPNTVHKNIPSFAELIQQINPAALSKNDYCIEYFRHLQKNIFYYLNIYADVMEMSIPKTKESKDVFFIDYGAGNGLMGLFAKYCGCKYVLINDLDPDFLEAASKLSVILNLKIDAFVLGDIDAVESACHNKQPDVIAGTDVIEHIYDLDLFFQKLSKINPSIVSCFTTASNPNNFFKVKKIRQLQHKDEWVGNDSGNVLQGMSHASFRKMRRSILESYFEGAELENWVSATRGMIAADIIQSISIYKASDKMPVPPSDKFNTCNPQTGSWTERILSMDEYHRLFQANKMSLQIRPGYYNSFRPFPQKIVSYLLNKLAFIFGTKFAPFIFLSGEAQKNKP